MSELKHYGVLGMKWGVRKDRSKKQTIKKSNDREITDALMKKDPRELSNQELNLVLARLGTEKRYEEILNNSSLKRFGKRIVQTSSGMIVASVSAFVVKKGKKAAMDFIRGAARGYQRSKNGVIYL